MAAARSPRVRAVVEAPLMSGDGPIRPSGGAGKLEHFFGELLATSQILGGADDEGSVAQGGEHSIGVIEATRHGHGCVGQTPTPHGAELVVAARGERVVPSKAARTVESSPGIC